MASSGANNAASLSIRAGSAGSFEFKINITEYPCIKCSPIFTFGGHDWCLKCRISPSKDAMLLLQLISGAEIEATIDLSLLGKNGLPSLVAFRREAHTFSSEPNGNMVLSVRRSSLEDHLTDDCFTVHCMIFVAGGNKKPYQISSSALGPNGLVEHLEKLLKGQDMSDVTFEVDGENFHAHRLVLAARSPVFKAELFGPMVEASKECIKVEGINSEVFRVLLRYLYTDMIDSADTKLTQHLLEAADRYAVDGLRTMCEERLCKNVTVDTVLSSLALADQHHCSQLLDACLDFSVAPENLLQLTLSQEYLDLMKSCPSVFAELCKRANSSFAFKNIINKKQRIV
jgi:speckle-type POZ protein